MTAPRFHFLRTLGHTHLRLAAWIVLLAAMFAGRFYRFYIAGWNAWILAVAGLVLAAIFGVGFLPGPVTAPARRGSAIKDWFETSCHFLPLLMFAVVGPSMPDLSTMRSTTFMAFAARAEAAPKPAGKPAAGDYLSVSLTDLRVSRDRLSGTTVEVLGKVHILTESDRAALPPEAQGKDIQVILYRYVITCCVADATPISAVIVGASTSGLHDDAWYRVRGRVADAVEGLDVPFIRIDTLQEIPEPVSPYLSGVDELFR
jgi:uncharacterized repeat protein (TIGR03943 family)